MAKIFTYKGELGIILDTKISVSMKNNQYPSTVAATRKNIVACWCLCISGCQKINEIGDDVDKKHKPVVCMHINPLLFQLLVFLCKGFAQHFLVELFNRWSASIEDTVKK